jgi:hypothetical protein
MQLLQAGRAIVAASPRVPNQARQVSGHGLSANTNSADAAHVAVTATRWVCSPRRCGAGR